MTHVIALIWLRMYDIIWQYIGLVTRHTVCEKCTLEKQTLKQGGGTNSPPPPPSSSSLVTQCVDIVAVNCVLTCLAVWD